MKIKLFNSQGKSSKEITLPDFFSGEIRDDIVAKVLEAKKTVQPYAPSLVAGKQHSASGKTVHRRHVWRSGYGRGASRIPRKIFTRRGSQFISAGAEVSSTRGGRRAHPPKVISMINTKKINKNEIRIALISSISATADKKLVILRYDSLKEKKLTENDFPIVVDSSFLKLKTKDILSSLKKVLGEDLFSVALRKKSIRSGKGKLRGRKYKSNAGLLFVLGNKEKLKISAFETKNVNRLGVKDLARGGLGRLTIYTESAVNELNEKLVMKTKTQK